MSKWPNHLLFKLSYMPYGVIFGGLILMLVTLWIWGVWRLIRFVGNKPNWHYLWILGGVVVMVWTGWCSFLFMVVDGAFPYPPSPNRGNFTCSDVMVSGEEIQTLFPGWKMLDQWVSHKRHEDYYGTTWRCTRFFSPYQGEVTTLEQLEALRRTEPFIVVTIYRFSDIFGPKVPWVGVGESLKSRESLETKGVFYSRYARVWRLRRMKRGEYLFEGVYEEFYLFLAFELPPERGAKGSPYTEEKVLRLVQLEDQKIGRFIERTQPSSVRQQVEP